MHKCFRVVLAGALCVLAGPLDAEVTLRLEPAGWTPESPRDIAIAIEPLATEATSGDAPATLVRQVPLPGGTTFDPPEGRWRIVVDEPGLWSPVEAIEMGSTSVELPVFRAGLLEGTVVVPTGSTTPEAVEVRLATVPKTKPEVTEALTYCPVEESRFVCRLPAVALDLRFELSGHVPHYAWGFELSAGEARSLGTLRFVRGASVVGRVEAPERDFDFADCEVELMQVAAGYSNAEERTRHGRRGMSAKVDDRGFFQVPGVAPGSYTLAVRHPRYVTAKLPPFQVEAGRETELPPLELVLPSILQVAVDPPTDPYRRPWRIRLHRRSADPTYLDLVSEGETTTQGGWEAGKLELETHWLILLDSRGATWERSPIELTPGVTEWIVDVPLERLEGNLVLADEPVANAQIVFKDAREGARTVVKSNEEGIFYVFLPRGRKWNLEITQRSEGIAAAIEEVTVPPKQPDEPWPRKDFVLPDTRVEGEVVNAQGLPLEHPALVDLWRDGESTPGHATRDDGRFVLRGIEPGPLDLEARQLGSEGRSGRRSERISIEVEEEVRDEPVRLTLQNDAVVEGQVVTVAGQGVAGARILAGVEYNLGSIPQGWWLPEAHSGADGVFRLELPPAAQAAWLTTMAPGFAVTQTRIEPSTGEPALVLVEPVGGTLSVVYEDPPVALRHQLKGHTVVTGRAPLRTSWALMEWARLHGVVSEWDRLVIPMLEPGPYEVCLNLPGSTGSSTTPCARGELPPHGHLELRLPVVDDENQ